MTASTAPKGRTTKAKAPPPPSTQPNILSLLALGEPFDGFVARVMALNGISAREVIRQAARKSLAQAMEKADRAAAVEFQKVNEAPKRVPPAPAPPRKAPSKPKPKPNQKARMPPLHERLRIVMGKDAVSIPNAIQRLRARDVTWVPQSVDLPAYISLTLSTNVKHFERVSRGVYRVKRPTELKLVG